MYGSDASLSLNTLEMLVLQAHQSGDSIALAELYEQGGDIWVQQGKINESCFCWTNAYVFALEQGLETEAKRIMQKLHQYDAL